MNEHNSDGITLVKCPTCGAKVAWSSEQRWRPFCSERCKLIDLGEWLDENHRIADPSEPQDTLPRSLDTDQSLN